MIALFTSRFHANRAMPNLKPVASEVRRQLRHQISWPMQDRCATKNVELCDVINLKTGKKKFTKEAKQDLEISALKHDLSQVHKLLNMVLTLVDPADVQAALEVKNLTPSNAHLRRLAAECSPPDELLDAEEERPW